MNRNLVGSILAKSSVKIAHFVPIRWPTWPTQAIIFSDWPILTNLLLWNRMAYWTESMYGRSSKTIAQFAPIRYRTWPAHANFVSDWSISKKSSALKPQVQMNKNYIWSIYGMSSRKIAHFVPIRYQTWSAHANIFSDWSMSKKSSHLKPHGQLNQTLIGSIYGKSSIKFVHFVSICYQTWPP
jgi:hypothetical protein